MIDRVLLIDRLGKERTLSLKIIVLGVMFVVVLILGAIAGLIGRTSNNGPLPPSETPERIPSRIAYITHDPILIDGNSEFHGPNASTGVTWGSGTERDPYVIEGWNINASSANGIEIWNANVHFIIRNCLIINNGWIGICLKTCANGTLDENTCSRSTYENGRSGICLDSSDGNNVSNNLCVGPNDGGYGIGIYLFGSNNNLMWNNSCSNHHTGIVLDGSNNNTLNDNNCSDNFWEGINLVASGDNTLVNNTCINLVLFRSYRYYYCGVDLVLSSGNVITKNKCVDSGSAWGIYLRDSSTDNLIWNNNCTNNSIGILLTSDRNTLTNNNCSHSSIGIDIVASNNSAEKNNCSDCDYGIRIYSSANNTISRNNCTNNVNDGVCLDSSFNNTLTNNNCSWNGRYGVYLYYSGNNDLTYNMLSANGNVGIYLRHSDNNIILLNGIGRNTGPGIGIYSGTNNRISYNTFILNNGAGDTYDPSHVQAYDYGTANWWNSTDGHGNYWSDLTKPDANHDEIVDWSYNLTGSAGAMDYYPLTTTSQVPIPEFGMMTFVVMVLLAVIVIAGETRRKKES